MSESVKIPIVSKSGVLTVILFVLFLITIRFLYPVGDEPDFSIRAPRVLFGEHPWWSPYYILSGFLKEIDLYSECKVDAGAFSLWASIDATSCTDNINNVFIRVLTTLFVTLPLLLVIVFPRILKNTYGLSKVKTSDKEIIDKINIMSICLIFPSILYYIGALAEEQLVLVLGLFSFFFAKSIIVILIIGVAIFSIDIGNSLIFITFYLVLYTLQSRFFYGYMKYKKTMLSILLLSILGLSFIGLEFFLNMLIGIDAFHQKSESIINAYSSSDLLNKYPVYLRPVITYMTSILSLPSGVKNIFAILVSIILFGNLFRRFLKRQEDINLKLDTLYFYSSIGVILAFVVLLPTYANAKYYIFLLPFLLKPLLFNANFYRSLFFVSFLSMSNFIVLSLYRL